MSADCHTTTQQGLLATVACGDRSCNAARNDLWFTWDSLDFSRLLKAKSQSGPSKWKELECCAEGCSDQGVRLVGCCRALREGPEWESLSEARRRIVESELRDFVLGGVALEV